MFSIQIENRVPSDMFMLIVFCLVVCLQSLRVENSDINIENSPRGHLKPLGSHREPQNSLMVDELDHMPSAEEFWTKYVKPSRAAVLKGAAKHARAFTKWTEDYLKHNFGDLEVRVEAKGEKSGKIPVGVKGIGRDTLGEYEF